MSEFKPLSEERQARKWLFLLDFNGADTEAIAMFTPSHMAYMNYLIVGSGILDAHVITDKEFKILIIITAPDKEYAIDLLSKSPLSDYWVATIEELAVVDGVGWRIPNLVLN